jgi:hypothetical protein
MAFLPNLNVPSFTTNLGLLASFDKTSLDLEDSNYIYTVPPINDTSTGYPQYTTGTPTIYANPGYANRFFQRWFPYEQYLDIYWDGNSRFTEDLGRGVTTFNLTNFDVENDGPDGFYSDDISTTYGIYTTGTPTIYANPSYAKRFSQPFFPDQQYLDRYSIAGNSRFTEDLDRGRNTLNITNFDVERLSSPIQDTITNYPPLTTGTPNLLSNPGPAIQFTQVWFPGDTYLDTYPIKGESRFTRNRSNGRNTFSMTDLDTEAPGVNGGIPYNQQKDPTVYPITTNGATPVRGYFATAGKPVSKFDQIYSATNTYSDFISDYI